MSANIVVLNGRIANDIDLKATSGGKTVITLTLAVQRNKDVTDFIPVVVWNKTAEFVKSYFSKGDGIIVYGRVSSRKWTDADGKNHTAIEVVANGVNFPDGKKATASRSESYDELTEDDYTDSLPF